MLLDVGDDRAHRPLCFISLLRVVRSFLKYIMPKVTKCSGLRIGVVALDVFFRRGRNDTAPNYYKMGLRVALMEQNCDFTRVYC